MFSQNFLSDTVVQRADFSEILNFLKNEFVS